MTYGGTQTPGPQTPSTGTDRPPGAPIVTAAFSLGWRLVESYIHVAPKGGPLEDRKGLAPDERIRLDADRVQARLTTVGSALRAAGLEPTGTIAKRSAVPSPTAPTNDEEAAMVLRGLHQDLLLQLRAAEPPLGIAYSLGQELAWACLTEAKDKTGPRFDRQSITRWQKWLRELVTLMPDHAARAVELSLSSWANKQEEDDKVKEQGDLWRQCLTGEKGGRDMLESEDYLRASRELVKRSVRELMKSVLFWVAISILVLLLVGAVLVAVLVQSPARLFGVLVPIAATFGITSTTLATAARRMADRVEEPVWGAELDEAIAIKITRLQPAAD